MNRQPLYPRIALTGYSRSGKDEAAKALFPHGYVRHAPGDIIKRQCDELIQKHFGFSAFTEDTAQKTQVRRTLEAWGDDNCERIWTEYWSTLPPLAVNTRLIRDREAREWKDRGGIVVAVVRAGNEPATDFEREQFDLLHNQGLVDAWIFNNADVAELHLSLLRIAFGGSVPR